MPELACAHVARRSRLWLRSVQRGNASTPRCHIADSGNGEGAAAVWVAAARFWSPRDGDLENGGGEADQMGESRFPRAGSLEMTP